MKTERRFEIETMCREFASGFDFPIAGSGWLIVDPLSGFLNYQGIRNSLQELPANEDHPQVLIMTFEEGGILIPAGSDLKKEGAHDWMWILKTENDKTPKP